MIGQEIKSNLSTNEANTKAVSDAEGGFRNPSKRNVVHEVEQIEALVASVEKMIGHLYKNHPDIDDLVQVARIAVPEAMGIALKRSKKEGCVYNHKQLSSFVKRRVLRKVKDWLNLSANKPFYPILNDIPYQAIKPADLLGRKTLSIRIRDSEDRIIDIFAERFNLSRGEVARCLMTVGFSAIAAVAAAEEPESN